jgi:hypothetical protein
MNYISLFTAEEVHEAKRCLLNMVKRPAGSISPHSPFASPEKKRGRANKFALNVHAANGESEQVTKEEPAAHSGAEDKKEGIEPKSRSAGGVWVQASDFPHSFQNFIVYHNTAKMTHNVNHTDRWVDAAQPYICNEKDIVIKLELDEEALKTQTAEFQASLAGRAGGDPYLLPGLI